ncbi:MAG TPA: sulfatase-like hydrolase/transferase [Acidimicrobiia bacterium]
MVTPAPAPTDVRRPNILLVVADQERQRGWIPPDLTLPHRQRLLDEGLEFTRFYTHSSPCSPSRATILTGRTVPEHGVVDNVVFSGQRELDPAIPTIGRRLRDAGYRTSYIGKWHLSHAVSPDLEPYGFSDWSGNDRHFMGWAGTGVEFDPWIAERAATWLAANAASPRPWLLVVGLVNPHDVMWFPIDQPDYQRDRADEVDAVKRFLEAAAWKETDPLPAYAAPYDEVFDTLPPNFDDDLFTKPAVQREWLYQQQHTLYGYLDPTDTRAWCRHLDYYWRLHQEGDRNLGLVLDALDASGAAAETAVIFTADHGDMCGSHGLRSKGPFVYDEIMRVPLYVKVPGVTAAATCTDALASHLDLARTVCALGGADAADLPGQDLTGVLADPSRPARDAVLFAQDMAWYDSCVELRYAIRGVFDGRYKYARYYGCGGGWGNTGRPPRHPKRVDVDAPFEDQDHELYDLAEDPHELRNLAMDRAHRGEVRDRFEQLRTLEAAELGTPRFRADAPVAPSR